MKIAACADLHLDRVPAFLSSGGDYAMRLVADYVIAHGYDVLLLSGDVMDSEDSWFSCYGPLVLQLQRLKNAGVHVIAVAGNHDFRVFSQIAGSDSDKLSILGHDGKWSFEDFNGVRFIGWSFPDSWFKTDPMLSYDRTLEDFSGPMIGLLHCDLMSSLHGSNYAGVLSSELENTKARCWMLGHIHQSGAQGKAFYCGSPVPLDRSEKGFHGIWSIEEKNGVLLSPEFVQISPAVYSDWEIKAGSVHDRQELENRIASGCKAAFYSLSDASAIPLKSVGLNLEFTGATDRNLDLDSALAGIKDFSLTIEETEVSVTGFTDHTEFDTDLEKLSGRPGPIGVLAKYLLSRSNTIENGISESLARVQNGPYFSCLDIKGDNDFDNEIKEAAKRLLRQMLRQEAAV